MVVWGGSVALNQGGNADAVVGGPGGGFFANDSGERFVVEMPQWGV